ncbi:MAG: bifunctional hydroxymethylpyrimidine kinase/phosphomethylpyrimidine kinase [Spirochaetia bacterium]|nr:bifunctional hydroxymethylpyrimidine kinase/phosphomethylpyrimidine kinase [Spirochaetia bacterium]
MKSIKEIPKILTIAGSDSIGGAGIQADIKTFSAFGCYSASAITAITAQNSMGINGIQAVKPDIVFKQIESVLTDITPDAVKTGMLLNHKIIKIIEKAFILFNVKNIVIDPVLVSTSGASLLNDKGQEALKKLFGLAVVVTPNLFEAEVLIKGEVKTLKQMEKAAIEIKKLGSKWVVIKGGHLNDLECIDVVYDGKNLYHLKEKKINTQNTHGSGCAFASAIAASMAKKLPVLDSIKKAKKFITMAVKESHNFSSNNGPVNHLTGVKSIW